MTAGSFVSTASWIVLGMILAVPYIAFARRSRRSAVVYSVGLGVASLIYVGFALSAGVEGRSLVLEGAGVLLYGALAVTGVMTSPLWTAAGWALHAVWDWGHAPEAAAYVPAWYRFACLGFDLVVAWAIVRSHRSGSGAGRRGGATP